MTGYDLRRIEARGRNARALLRGLGSREAPPGHTYWLFPYRSGKPDEVIEALRRRGIDSARYGRLEVVAPPADRPEVGCTHAHRMLEETVFLPCYPELTGDALERIIIAVQGVEA